MLGSVTQVRNFICRLAGGVLLIATHALPLKAEKAPQSVLVIEATSPNTTYFIGVNSAFNSAVSAETLGRVFVYVESLAVRNFESPGYQALLRDFFREKYRDKNLTAIVAYNTLALTYAVRLRDEVWPDVPVIFTGVSDRHFAEMKRPDNVTGVTIRNRLKDAVDIARTLLPKTRTVVLVGDKLGTEGYWKYFGDELPEVEQSMSVSDLTGMPITEVRARVAALPQDAAIVYLGLFRDSSGRSFVPSAALKVIAEAANRPVIVDTESFVGPGGLGGPVLKFDEIGLAAAELLRRVLAGEQASDIPVRNGDVLKPIFDWRQLQRWDIPESRLPAGSEIRFRPPTAWEQYRWQILLFAGAIVIQSLLILGLLQERRRRRQAEVETRLRLSELAYLNRSATAGEMSASIAHEINQPLAAIVSSGNAGLRWLAHQKPDLDEVRASFKRIVDDGHRAARVIDTIRSLFKKESQPRTSVDINDLIEEVLQFLRIDFEQNHVALSVVLTRALPPISGDRVQLQQVILNIVRNGIEAISQTSGRQRTMQVRSEMDEQRNVLVSIADSGSGIDAENLDRVFEPFFTTKAGGMGMGLSICRSIVEAHEGHLSVKPVQPYGSVFQIVLPTNGSNAVV
jgi:signal transduction histidine kinase